MTHQLKIPNFEFNLEPFKASQTILDLRANKKVSRDDILNAAKDLLAQIDNHPTATVRKFSRDKESFEENAKNYKERSIVSDAFSGGFSGGSRMTSVENALFSVKNSIEGFTGLSRFFTRTKTLGDKLLKAFEAMERIDSGYPRNEMIEEFDRNLKKELRIESGESLPLLKDMQTALNAQGRSDRKTWVAASALADATPNLGKS
jgi:hypothetical protein